MKSRSSPISILLVLGLLTSGGGCQVLHIPSYRADSSGAGYCSVTGTTPAELGLAAAECPPGFLPPLPPLPAWTHRGVPVPGWWAKWRAKEDLPDPAPYPRFHPLPTRPMFSSHPQASTLGQNTTGQNTTYGWSDSIPPQGATNYGQLPPPTPGGVSSAPPLPAPAPQ